METFFNPELFGTHETENQDFTFGPVTVRLACATAATTDFDMTGVIVWPASRLLAWYIVANPSSFVNQDILEVGAGCGVGGFVTAELGGSKGRIAITDGEPKVVEILEKSAALLREDAKEDKDVPEVVVDEFVWGDGKEDVVSMLEKTKVCPSVVIGADVCHPSFGDPGLLFDSLVHVHDETIRVRAESSESSEGRTDKADKQQQQEAEETEPAQALTFIASLADRGNIPDVLAAADKYGFEVTVHEPESFLPENLHIDELTVRSVNVYEFVRQPSMSCL